MLLSHYGIDVLKACVSLSLWHHASTILTWIHEPSPILSSDIEITQSLFSFTQISKDVSESDFNHSVKFHSFQRNECPALLKCFLIMSSISCRSSTCVWTTSRRCCCTSWGMWQSLRSRRWSLLPPSIMWSTWMRWDSPPDQLCVCSFMNSFYSVCFPGVSQFLACLWLTFISLSVKTFLIFYKASSNVLNQTWLLNCLGKCWTWPFQGWLSVAKEQKSIWKMFVFSSWYQSIRLSSPFLLASLAAKTENLKYFWSS